MPLPSQPDRPHPLQAILTKERGVIIWNTPNRIMTPEQRQVLAEYLKSLGCFFSTIYGNSDARNFTYAKTLVIGYNQHASSSQKGRIQSINDDPEWSPGSSQHEVHYWYYDYPRDIAPIIKLDRNGKACLNV